MPRPQKHNAELGGETNKLCRPQDHRYARRTPETFAAATRYLGLQTRIGESPLMLGICRVCGSSICRELTADELERLERKAGKRGARC
jgi:hypothetical protein